MELHLHSTYVYMASCLFEHKDNLVCVRGNILKFRLKSELNDSFKIMIIGIYHPSTVSQISVILYWI
jgi:hypothetical protein